MNRKRARAAGKSKQRKRQQALEGETFRIVCKPDPPDFERQMERVNRRMRRLHGPPINETPREDPRSARVLKLALKLMGASTPEELDAMWEARRRARHGNRSKPRAAKGARSVSERRRASDGKEREALRDCT